MTLVACINVLHSGQCSGNVSLSAAFDLTSDAASPTADMLLDVIVVHCVDGDETLIAKGLEEILGHWGPFVH